MNIQVRGDHIPVTEALHEYVDRKVGRLEKYFDAPPEREVHVTMSVERGSHRIEVQMQVHGVIFRAEEKSEDMYASIDLVTDKLEQQIYRHKAKLNQKFRDKGLRTRIQASLDRGAFVTTGEPIRGEDDYEDFKIVRTKRVPIKPMAIEEAVLQMDLLGHDFYVFHNADTDEMNVIYRRKRGDYGLIEPR